MTELIMKYFVLKLIDRIDVEQLCFCLGILNCNTITGKQLAICILKSIIKK